MKKKKPFLTVLEKSVACGCLPSNGICASVERQRGNLLAMYEAIYMFRPSFNERAKLRKKGLCSAYWASGLKISSPTKMFAITDLRQMFLCFMAAVNGEL